jgi:hypothetical protein
MKYHRVDIFWVWFCDKSSKSGVVAFKCKLFRYGGLKNIESDVQELELLIHRGSYFFCG